MRGKYIRLSCPRTEGSVSIWRWTNYFLIIINSVEHNFSLSNKSTTADYPACAALQSSATLSFHSARPALLFIGGNITIPVSTFAAHAATSYSPASLASRDHYTELPGLFIAWFFSRKWAKVVYWILTRDLWRALKFSNVNHALMLRLEKKKKGDNQTAEPAANNMGK